MRKIKIVADSSADITILEGADFSAAPLKVVTDEREFVDNASLDVEEMVEYLQGYSGKSSTSCPNTGDWLTAFSDADEVYCVTITSGLSGSFNAARVAAEQYEAEHPERKVLVVDSLSTGGEMVLIMEKIRDLVQDGRTFEEISAEIPMYQQKLGLLFMLQSMRNLANNGRVSKLSAKFAGLMNIRVVGKASDVGTLEPLDKVRGEKATLQKLVERLEELGYRGGKLRITHCFNAQMAEELKELVRKKFQKAQIAIEKCGGLCSFYAEKGGMIVGFEKA